MKNKHEIYHAILLIIVSIVILYFLISTVVFTAAFGVGLYFVCLTNHEYYMDFAQS